VSTSVRHKFNTIKNIEPIYNIDDYARESKYRLEIEHKRCGIMIEENKRKNKEFFDLTANDIDISIGDKVLLKNETGHKLDSKYTGPYTVESLEDNENIIISNNKNMKQTILKDRLKTLQIFQVWTYIAVKTYLHKKNTKN